MSYLLRNILIILTLFNTIFAEETFSLLKEPENEIENIRRFVFNVSQIPKKERKAYFKEINLTRKEFNYLKNLSELNWKIKGTYPLLNSNATINLPEGYALLIGSDIKSLHDIQNSLIEESDEAYVVKLNDSENAIIFSNINTGYVSIDDWNEIDSKELLEQISENTEKKNTERKKNGEPLLHVVGWLQKPTLNKKTSTVYWAFEVEAEGSENVVNSIAIKLGRESYEQFVWICPKSSYGASPDYLNQMLLAHQFNPGYRYEDYSVGDRIAEYGIAGLVGASIGGKMIKATGLLVFF